MTANGNMGKPSCHHLWCTQTLKLAYWTTCTTSEAGERKNFLLILGGAPAPGAPPCLRHWCRRPCFSSAVQWQIIFDVGVAKTGNSPRFRGNYKFHGTENLHAASPPNRDTGARVCQFGDTISPLLPKFIRIDPTVSASIITAQSLFHECSALSIQCKRQIAFDEYFVYSAAYCQWNCY